MANNKQVDRLTLAHLLHPSYAGGAKRWQCDRGGDSASVSWWKQDKERFDRI